MLTLFCFSPSLFFSISSCIYPLYMRIVKWRKNENDRNQKPWKWNESNRTKCKQTRVIRAMTTFEALPLTSEKQRDKWNSLRIGSYDSQSISNKTSNHQDEGKMIMNSSQEEKKIKSKEKSNCKREERHERLLLISNNLRRDTHRSTDIFRLHTN